MKPRIRSIAKKALPVGTKRYSFVKRLQRKKTTVHGDYQDWIKNIEPNTFSSTNNQLKKLKNRPLISVVVPCYNTPDKYIVPLIESVKEQLYEVWELCLADGSTDVTRQDAIERLAKTDSRIKYKKLAKNDGIVGNTNQAIKMASGDYVGFLDHDDLLSRYALAEAVIAIDKNPKLDLLYSDEDKLSDDGKTRLNPFFKPNFSPDLLLGVNYITHFVIARTSLVRKMGGIRKGFDGAQDYDFLLRITESTSQIFHIPKILYHWRLADGSTAKDVGEKSYADTAGRRALQDAMKRRSIKAEVIEIKDRPTNYRLRYVLPKIHPKVSIIIPFKDKAVLLKQCVGSIIKLTTYKNYEITLVSNNSTEKETHDYLKEIGKHPNVNVYYWDNPFNYSAVNNFGVSKSTGDYLVLLNNDTEVLTSDWLEELVGQASQPNIGAVGPLLRYPTRDIQHAGVVLGMGGMAGHVFRHHDPSDWTIFGMPCWPRNYLAVTGACLVIEAKKYKSVGGLDETFTIAGNDVALGISLTERGYRNVYWPFAELIHYENVSVGSYNNVPIKDYEHSLTYYKPYLPDKDPYYNVNLDIMNERVGLKF